MSLAKDFGVYVATQLASLKNAPAGVPSQVGELTAILAQYDTARKASDTDPKLSPKGKSAAAEAAVNSVRSDIAKWHTQRVVDGLDRQLAAVQQRLLTMTGAAIPEPPALRVQHLATRLANLDPLEVVGLYSGANPEDQRAIEVVNQTLGRQPVRRSDGQLAWAPLLDADAIATAVLARAEKADAATAQQVRDLQRLRNAYTGLSAQALQLVNKSLPAAAA